MTIIKLDRTMGRAANLSFTAATLALFGWTQAEALLLTHGAGIRGHLFSTAIALMLSASAYRRWQRWRAHSTHLSHVPSSKNRSIVINIASATALPVVGFVLSYALGMGFCTVVTLAAWVFAFAPWSKSSFCLRHFFVAQSLLITGGLPILIIETRHLPFLFLLASTWVLWTLATVLVLLALWSQRLSVSPSSRYEAVPEPYVSDKT